MKLAQRIQELPTYIFAQLGKRIQALKAEGVDVIRLDIGSPDLAPPAEVVDVLEAAARRPDTHGYAGFYGDPCLRQAVARFYRRRFGVELDPETEILALIGSKEGIHHLPTAFVDPGSVVLVPDPGYPTYRVPALLVGGEIYRMPLLRENDFLPDLGAIPDEIAARARVLWLNYPNNPTSAVADLDFLKEAVAFARAHDILLAYDNPYSEISWEDGAPPSVLQVAGAKEIAVEFNSLSKMANMAGWRVGMVAGSAPAIAAIARVKTNTDTGIFRPIQEAAAVALELPEAWHQERNAIYARRRAVVTRALDRMNLWYAPYGATLYVWAEIPSGFTSSVDFAGTLLEEAGVSLPPGTAFGPNGEGYVRISLVQPEARLEEAMERWERWLMGRSLGVDLGIAREMGME
ncbi:MAG: aminotransferase class I/II-fold pyridoxal phosphate-dependent enzyme [Anaerolineae bacterium]